MATKIKAIKCPQCGSTRGREIKEDQYECQSCGTVYFLDSDDVTVHHKHEFVSDESGPGQYPNKKMLMVAGIVGFMVLMLMLIVSNLSQISRGGDASTGVLSQSKERWELWGLYPFVAKDSRPLVLAVGTRTRGSYPDEKEHIICAIYDPLKEEQIRTKELTEIKELDNFAYDVLRQFEDGSIHLIFNQLLWMRLDPSSLEINPVPESAYSDIPAFSSGIATFSYSYSRDGDALKVMTNLGKEIYYYPIIKQAYTSDELHQVQRQPLPQPVTRTYFAFTSESTDYKEEPIQLIRYTQQTQIGYPKNTPSFFWRRDYGGSGIFTDADPYRKVLISSYSQKYDRVLSYQDLTPGAHYFDPDILWQDGAQLLIRYKPTAAPQAKYLYQLMDGQTGKPLWTLSSPEEFDGYPDRGAVVTPSATVIVQKPTVWLITPDGKGQSIATLE